MNTDANLELTQFYQFVGEKLAVDSASITPEEALDEWRQTHQSSNQHEEDLAAIREALGDMANGDLGVSLEEFDREFRRRHGLIANS